MRNVDKVEEIIARFSHDRTLLVPAFHEVQEVLGYLPDPVLAMIAAAFSLSKAEVLGVASFYPSFQLKQRATFVVRCCSSVLCEMHGGGEVIKAVRKVLHLRDGERTRDGMFLLQVVSCLGACDRSPAIMVNDRVFGDLTPKKVTRLLQELARTGTLPEEP